MKSKMTGVAALLLLAATSPVSSWTCSTNCSCGRGPGYAFAECPSTRRSLTVYNEAGRYMQVTCYEPNTDLNILQSFDAGPVPHLIIKQCSLPTKNYSELLESTRTPSFKHLDICDTNSVAIDLRDRLFGLGNITSLTLNNLGLANVPDDFLQNVPQIRNLDLRFNKLQLPLGVFDNMQNLRILELSGNSLEYLEPGIFRNTSKLYRLSAWTNRLHNLTRETFIGLGQLVALDLNSNGIQELPEDVFAELHNLKVIALYANNFTRLPSNLFTNTSKLEMIRMNDNRRELASLPPRFLSNLTHLKEAYLHRMFLSNLPEDLFHGSGNLLHITLNGNNLKMLPENLFRDANYLLTLDISDNKMEHLPHNIFSTLSELQLLNLGNNQLTKINELLFANMYNLESLFLRQNAISDIHGTAFFNLAKLRKLDISNNMLTFSSGRTSSPLSNCNNLEYLYLSKNSIENIFDDWRNVMTELKVIDLSHNKITRIEAQDLTFLSRRVKLDVTHNNISNIDLQAAEVFAKSSVDIDGEAAQSVTVHLDGNPLHCGCGAYGFLRYLEMKVDPRVRGRFKLVPGSLKCASPPMYEGRSASSLQTEHLMCDCEQGRPPRQAASTCPVNCTCCAKPHSGALVVDCSNAGLSRAPEELPREWSVPLSHTQLLLRGNNITGLPNASQPGYEQVTLIDASYNRLSALRVEHLPPRLQSLNLSHNQLTELDKPVLAFLSDTINVALQGNPWSCSCKIRDLLLFIHSHFRQVSHLLNITCNTEDGDVAALLSTTVEDICPTDTVLTITHGVTIAVVGLLLGVITTLFCCHQHKIRVWLYTHNMLLWWVTKKDFDEDKQYDVFISSSHKDSKFVIKDLAPWFESGPKPFKLCLEYRDWTLGEYMPLAIARSINESRRTLVVLSPSFLETIWGMEEFREAHRQAFSESRARVIFLLYGNTGPMENLDHELQAYLRMNTYVKWGDPWFWDKLRYALPHRSPIKEKHYHLNAAAVSDKMDLMFPAMSTPAATTPPADAVNPVFIIDDKAAVEKEAN